MTREIIVPSLILLLMLSAAIAQDVRSRRIPNGVVVAGLVAGVFWHAVGPPGAWAFDRHLPGATGVMGASVAAVASLLTLLPLYRWRLLGAGDVKLLAAIAACLGVSNGHWTHLPGVALMVLVSGGGLAVVRMTSGRLAGQVWANVRAMVRRLRPQPGLPWRKGWPETADRMPYSLAIALGTTFYLVSSWNGYLTMV